MSSNNQIPEHRGNGSNGSGEEKTSKAANSGSSYNPKPHSVDAQSPNIYDVFKKNGLHFLHLNARSLLPKIDQLKHLATSTQAAVIGVTETWLNSAVLDSEICIPGYLTERKDRSTDGGGVCVYIRKDVAYNCMTDLNSNTVEAVWIDILLPKTKPILTGICYRPPKDNNFYMNLEIFLAPKVSFQNEGIFIQMLVRALNVV